MTLYFCLFSFLTLSFYQHLSLFPVFQSLLFISSILLLHLLFISFYPSLSFFCHLIVSLLPLSIYPSFLCHKPPLFLSVCVCVLCLYVCVMKMGSLLTTHTHTHTNALLHTHTQKHIILLVVKKKKSQILIQSLCNLSTYSILLHYIILCVRCSGNCLFGDNCFF